MKKLLFALLFLASPVFAQTQTQYYTVPTIAALKAMTTSRPAVVQVVDANPGIFNLSSGACSAADDIFQVQPTAGTTVCYTRLATPYSVGKSATANGVMITNGSGVPSISTTLPAVTIPFTQAGSGATARNVQTKLREIISVTDYGADPTGSADSAAAFAAAVAECVTITGTSTAVACTIHVPVTPVGNSYKISSQVNIAANGVTFKCDAGARIMNNTTNASALYFGDGSTQYYASGLDGCTFGQLAGLAVYGNRPFTFSKMGQFAANNWTIQNGPSLFYEGPLFSQASQFFVTNYQVTGTSGDGVSFIRSSDGYITNARSDSNAGAGHAFRDSEGFYVTNVTAFNNSTNGVVVGTIGYCTVFTTDRCVRNMFFTSVIADTSGSDNWLITDCQVCKFVDAWGSTQISGAVNTTAAGFRIVPRGTTPGAVRDLTFVGGAALYNNGNGVDVVDAGLGAGIPNSVQFTNFDFGNEVNPNGYSSTGTGLFVSNVAGYVSVIGGQMPVTGTQTTSYNVGAFTTFNKSNVRGSTPFLYNGTMELNVGSTNFTGLAVSNGTNNIGRLIGVSGANDGGSLFLYNGGVVGVQLSSAATNYLTQGLIIGGTADPGGGNLRVVGTTTLNSALTYGGITLSNAVTGTGNMVLSASPTFTGTLTAATGVFSATIKTGGYTVATLPVAPGTGARAYVTDQLTTCAIIGAAPTGGGVLTCPVFYNGAAWVGG